MRSNRNRQNRFPRYVRKWLFDHLAPLSTCAGAACRVEIGPDPAPAAEERGAAEAEEEAWADPGLGFVRPGALAKLAKAPASKVGDSRFESWVPRSQPAGGGLN